MDTLRNWDRMAKKIEVITSHFNAATERPSPPDQSLSYFDGMRGPQRRKINFLFKKTWQTSFFVARDWTAQKTKFSDADIATCLCGETKQLLQRHMDHQRRATSTIHLHQSDKGHIMKTVEFGEMA